VGWFSKSDAVMGELKIDGIMVFLDLMPRGHDGITGIKRAVYHPLIGSCLSRFPALGQVEMPVF
jgi:hypothetical protein